MLSLNQLLDRLEKAYGQQQPNWPTNPYLFLVWWLCGYPASDSACGKGWESLQSNIGTDPEQLLTANPSKMALALKPGGMVPELRTMRLKEIAERVQKEFGGDLPRALKALPIARARTVLKKFPNIADPGADRILLFAGLSPLAAVPSNCPHVLVRIRAGRERENYGVTYKEAQRMIEEETPKTFAARTRAYLILKCHGQQVCKRTNPKCDACVVSSCCAFFGGKTRGRAS
ncbi:MAG TPA: hypothetical protein VMT15_04395 [Bryobacteraceae bacterium]|nr:hypothetical protein [Bryobacteraceae bacterium]